MAQSQPPPTATTRSTRIRRRSACVLVAASTALLLGACNVRGADGASPATTVQPTATVAPEPDPSPWTALPTLKDGPNKGTHTGAVLASSVAQTPEEQDAVQAYLAYWRYFVKVGHDVKVDRARARKVARQKALGRLNNKVTGLRRRNARTVGWASINVEKVWVGEYGVLVWACVDNGTRKVDRATGERLGKSPVAYDSVGGVHRINGKLVVTSFRTPSRSTACTP